jgi:hypothetical protein
MDVNLVENPDHPENGRDESREFHASFSDVVKGRRQRIVITPSNGLTVISAYSVGSCPMIKLARHDDKTSI